MARQEMARYLRERRAALRPQDIGLTTTGSARRTAGLRREEVAELAHMSVDYYARLEQGRGPRPSARILDALAGALRLAPAERSHLFRLAGSSAPPGVSAVRQVRPHVARMLERLPETGAIVTDATYDVVAWNPLARALLGAGPAAGGVTNLARRRFLGRDRMYESSSAEEFGHIVVARLRRAADRYPHDRRLAALLAELHAGSEEFSQIWQARPVHDPGHRTKVIDHPEAGTLRLNCDVLLVPEDDQEVVLITADPGSPAARTLRRLAGQAA
ncbi:Helix-turn-helix domain-containing protein [Streptomyces sp. DvalAA-14]|uniref:helix-turn-helix transcriptional regulator n=1 Tax=unclassified Streptomyces TaxID=2593676 RepID=UPI00081AFB76|nr:MULTISPECIES: helix-turn-helix transcriptional regulator [unclassified Streptomyces]MYS20232.1 helix-turn-helix domain-containing protein [Streptomyces sp. SID4948]SCD64034.1 Helix-turn-helix domain-containing protein [Streptomyces sp. DvalAA-14]